ncbi:hypothetical protein HK405_002291, partial [Cladochytrium tenue]
VAASGLPAGLFAHFATPDPYVVPAEARAGLAALAVLPPSRRPLIGVLSDSDPRTRSVLSHVGLASVLDFVVLSYETGTPKPDRRAFDAALAAAASAVAPAPAPGPSDAIYVGDSEE